MKKYAFVGVVLVTVLAGCYSVDADTGNTTSLDDASYLNLKLGIDGESVLIKSFGEAKSHSDTVYKTYCYIDTTERTVLFKFYDLAAVREDPKDSTVNQVRMVEITKNAGKEIKPLCKKTQMNFPIFDGLKLGMSFSEAMKIFSLNGFSYTGSKNGKGLVNYFIREGDIGMEETPESLKQYAEKGFVKNISYTVKVDADKVVSVAKELSYMRKF